MSRTGEVSLAPGSHGSGYFRGFPGPGLGSRDERGAAALAATLILALVVGLGLLLAFVGAAQARGQGVRGAADLAALAGARAQAEGLDACGEARRTAQANAALLVGCAVRGDEIEFVVTVELEASAGSGPWRWTPRARANAGVLAQ